MSREARRRNLRGRVPEGLARESGMAGRGSMGTGAGSEGRRLALAAAAGASTAGAAAFMAYALWTTGGLSPAALALAAFSLAGALAALRRAGAARMAAEKASAELDAVSARLIALESRPAVPAAEPAPALRAQLGEVTTEIALLSGLVKDLAVALGAQDRALAELRERAAPPREPPREPAREPAPLPSEPAPAPRASWPPLEVRRAPDRPTEAPPAVPALRIVKPAPAGTPETRLAAILDAFEAERVELYLQPIVSLPQRRPRLYELSGRLRLDDETLLAASDCLPALERAGLAGAFDRHMVARAALVARHLATRSSEAQVLASLSAASLAEPGFARALGRTLEGVPDASGRVVLGIGQTVWRGLEAVQAGALAVLAERGVPFALDRAQDARLDPRALAERGVRYAKLPSSLLLRPERIAPRGEVGRDLALGDLGAALARAGIGLVAEGVEREEEVPDLIDLDIALAQGRAFAAPRPLRSEVLTERPATPAAEPPAPAPAPVPEERQPFRAFLRRAG